MWFTLWVGDAERGGTAVLGTGPRAGKSIFLSTLLILPRINTVGLVWCHLAESISLGHIQTPSPKNICFLVHMTVPHWFHFYNILHELWVAKQNKTKQVDPLLFKGDWRYQWDFTRASSLPLVLLSDSEVIFSWARLRRQFLCPLGKSTTQGLPLSSKLCNRDPRVRLGKKEWGGGQSKQSLRIVQPQPTGRVDGHQGSSELCNLGSRHHPA
jgi:hypothetical protein